MILAILYLHVPPMPPTKVCLDRFTIWEQIWLKIFKMAAVVAILDIWTERF